MGLSLSEKIKEFDIYYKIDFCLEECLKSYVDNGLEGLIKTATLSRGMHRNKLLMHNHQYKVGLKKLEKFFVDKMSKIDCSLFEEANSFDEILNIVERNRIIGIGELTCYDIAFRIAYCLNIYPDKVYLHRGSKDGAKKLLNKKIRRRFLKKEDLPLDFENMECYKIVIFLCQNRNFFKKE